MRTLMSFAKPADAASQEGNAISGRRRYAVRLPLQKRWMPGLNHRLSPGCLLIVQRTVGSAQASNARQ